MSTEPQVPARRLADDHRELEQTFDELLARARGGDWHDLDEVWGQFVGDVEDHFDFEEKAVFPAYAKRGTHCRRIARRLVREHADIRRLLDELGVQIQLHAITDKSVEALVRRMREHAELEDLEVYPWADLQRSRGDFSARYAAW